jgi:hypothetical protein
LETRAKREAVVEDAHLEIDRLSDGDWKCRTRLVAVLATERLLPNGIV